MLKDDTVIVGTPVEKTTPQPEAEFISTRVEPSHHEEAFAASTPADHRSFERTSL